MKERPLARQAMFNSFALPDEASFGVYKALQDVYPAFSKKLFENNELMQSLVMSGYNPMHILDYPICGKCETLAAPNGYGVKGKYKYPKCTCVAKGCGTDTVNPVTLRDWMKDELKNKVPKDFVDAMEFAIDGVAAHMLKMYFRNMAKIQENYSQLIKPKIGSPETDSETVIEEEVVVQHMGSTDEPNLPKDIEEIQGDL